MIAFIDDHRGAHGVEPICKVLPIAPSTYHDHVAKRADPTRLSARAKIDAGLKDEIRRVFEANFRVYGVRKVWRQLRREGFPLETPMAPPRKPSPPPLSLVAPDASAQGWPASNGMGGRLPSESVAGNELGFDAPGRYRNEARQSGH